MGYGVDPGTSSHNSYLFSTGYYIDGLKHGTWIEYSDTKETYEQFTFDKGNLDGPYSAWRSYGRLEGYFVNNARQGNWCDVDSAGTVLREEFYVDNKVKATNQPFKVPGLNKNFRKYLVKEMSKYREQFKGRMVEVYVTVDEKGYVTDPISKDDIREELKWAINQVLLKSPQVDPGTYNDIPKKMTVRIMFGYNFDAMSVKL